MELKQKTLVTCETCSNKVPIKTMKFDITGTSLICIDCSETQKSRSTKGYERKQLGESLALQRRTERANYSEPLIIYQCDSCSYSFSRKQSFKFRQCPNCGNNSINIKQANSAQKILDESGQDTDLGIDFV